MSTCPYCDQDLYEDVCRHWVATINDDGDLYDSATPLYFGWTENFNEAQWDMMAALDAYFEALCKVCDTVVSDAMARNRLLSEAKLLPPDELSTLRSALGVLCDPSNCNDYETTREILRTYLAKPMKQLFSALFLRSATLSGKAESTINDRSGLSWSLSHYCAPNVAECVASIAQESKLATQRLIEVANKD